MSRNRPNKNRRKSNTVHRKNTVSSAKSGFKASSKKGAPAPMIVYESNYTALCDWIMSYVYQSDKQPLTAKELFSISLPLTALYEMYDDEPETIFRDALKSLVSQNRIVYTRGKLAAGITIGYVEGTFRATSRGFGFLTPDEIYKERYPSDFFVGPGDTLSALNGDHVAARIKMTGMHHRDGQSPEVGIYRIIAHALREITGTLTVQAPSSSFHNRYQENHSRNQRTRYVVRPDNTKLPLSIEIDAQACNGAVLNDKVSVEITQYPSPEHPSAIGKVSHVFGAAETKTANYEAILYDHGVRMEFSPEVQNEARTVAARPIVPDGRLDLRDRLIFTIDSASAKDLDDAISLEKTESGWLLGVHIADVGEYVPLNSAIDREAFLRGTSIYFADQVVPMLPQALSNGCCSLNGGVDRYALSAMIQLSPTGDIQDCTLHESIIRSCVRGVYAEINDVIAHNTDSEWYAKYAMLFPETLPQMLQLYKLLEQKGIRKGALDLESSEAKLELDENGNVTDIVLRERGISEKMIEQFMLCANEGVASELHRHQMPCVYRIHEDPPMDKLEQFSLFAYNLGLNIKPLKISAVQPKMMQMIMDEAKEKGLGSILSSVMLRSLSKAKYSAEPSPHFGLATAYYCHFTSPIRRYPDLTTHRFIKAILHNKTDEKIVSSMRSFAAKSAEQSSVCEMEALYAERDIEDLYKVLFMQDKIGEEFDGVISSVTSFGFFVDFYQTCEGLVPIQSLPGYWIYDEKRYRLQYGEMQYRLGDHVRVRLERADVITRKMDLAVIKSETQDS